MIRVREGGGRSISEISIIRTTGVPWAGCGIGPRCQARTWCRRLRGEPRTTDRRIRLDALDPRGGRIRSLRLCGRIWCPGPPIRVEKRSFVERQVTAAYRTIRRRGQRRRHHRVPGRGADGTGHRTAQLDAAAARSGACGGLVASLLRGTGPPAVLAEQELHFHRCRIRRRRGSGRPRRDGAELLPRTRRGHHRSAEPGDAGPARRRDGQWAPRGHRRPRWGLGPARPGPWLPDDPAGRGTRKLLRLQPVMHFHAGRDRATGQRGVPHRVPASAVVRSAGHRRDRLDPGRVGPRDRLQRNACQHGGGGRPGPALPAGRPLG